MTRTVKWLGVCLGSLALMSGANAKDLPSSADIAFEHHVIAQAYVTSPFGMREDPFRKRLSWHGGIDLGTNWDAAIHAPASGTVIYADNKKGYGDMVDLQVSDGWVIRFAHMSDIHVAVGDEVSAGDVLGEVGGTGRSAGPHLHLEARYDDKQYDPLQLAGLRLFETENRRPN